MAFSVSAGCVTQWQSANTTPSVTNCREHTTQRRAGRTAAAAAHLRSHVRKWHGQHVQGVERAQLPLWSVCVKLGDLRQHRQRAERRRNDVRSGRFVRKLLTQKRHKADRVEVEEKPATVPPDGAKRRHEATRRVFGGKAQRERSEHGEKSRALRCENVARLAQNVGDVRGVVARSPVNVARGRLFALRKTPIGTENASFHIQFGR